MSSRYRDLGGADAVIRRGFRRDKVISLEIHRFPAEVPMIQVIIALKLPGTVLQLSLFRPLWLIAGKSDW